MVSLITGEIITGSKQGQSPDTTEQGATPLDSIDDEQDTPPLDSITTTGEQATPSLDSIDSTTEQESILSGEIPLVMPLSAIAMTTTDAQGNFSFPVNDAGMYYLTYTLVAPHSVYDAYPGKNPLTNTPNAAKINQAELQVILLTGDSSI
ncbi:MAG: hypothetical protein LBP53_07740 [Candidatus Peribacteria bacterium]|jgi:hypothetical protein|nr:hypothetical protein [Candidatus Peribacteria bacterium]